MKKLMMILAGAAMLFTSCGEKGDGPKITEAAKWYITGDATYFDGKEDAAQLGSLNLDSEKSNGLTETDVVLGNFAFLKAGSFNVELKDGSVVYGGTKTSELYVDGDSSLADIGDIYTVTDKGAAITITDPGMYFVALNTDLKEVSVVKVNWGLIGGAINGWSDELPLGEATYNNGVVTWEKTNVTIKKDSYKFRFGQGWGVTLKLNTDETNNTINTYSDITGVQKGDANVLTEAFANLQSGGDNIANATAGIYTVTLKYIISDNLYQAKIVKTGDYVPSYPENLYFTGNSYNNWTWDEGSYGTMIKTKDEGKFWAFVYLQAGVADEGLKFSPALNWDAAFGVSSATIVEGGAYDKGGENAKVAASGVYQVVVDLVAEKVYIEKPVVYLLGDVVGGVWGADAFIDANKFTVDDEAGTITSPAFANAGNLRMCMRNAFLDDENWWKAEFNVIDGQIAYRAKGEDQAAVAVTVGQKAILNIKTGAGSIE
ncbi:MAG: SusF/SusE family outer membrane protein [Tidjanibacter sp.]|nr:SusF/SusE family outer membrane protein [Tidjanibacter sp.]